MADLDYSDYSASPSSDTLPQPSKTNESATDFCASDELACLALTQDATSVKWLSCKACLAHAARPFLWMMYRVKVMEREGSSV